MEQRQSYLISRGELVYRIILHRDKHGFRITSREDSHKDDHVEGKTLVVVDKIPNCDMCVDTDDTEDIKFKPAYADGKTTMGQWANMCWECFNVIGVGLGVGLGQVLQLRSDIKE